MSRVARSSRRELIKAGLFGAAGVAASATVVPAVLAQSQGDLANDIKILNGALFYEHQAIWAYDFAAGKLSSSDVGKTVLAIAQANQDDHKAHRDLLAKVVKQLGGVPVAANTDYIKTVTPYVQNREGNLDSDLNIAKLALALEVDAAIAYGGEVAKLKTPELITAAASIGSTEASHATLIRVAFHSLNPRLKVVPAAFISKDTRKDWIIKV